MTRAAKPSSGLSLEHLSYLRRDFVRGIKPESLSWAPARKESVRLLHLSSTPAAADPHESPRRRGTSLPRLSDVLTGLHNLNCRAIFTVDCDGTSVRVGIGTCSYEGQGPGEAGAEALVSLLRGSLPGIEFASMPPGAPWSTLQGSASEAVTLAYGTPLLPGDDDAHTGIDRILQGMRGLKWVYAVVAAPIPRKAVEDLATSIINERRRSLYFRESSGGDQPIADRYEELLEGLEKRLDRAAGAGAWHAITYLAAADSAALGRLSALARATFSRPGASPDPYDVSKEAPLRGAGSSFALPVSEAPEAAGVLRYPFAMGSMVDSSELAVLVDPPRGEYPGYEVRPVVPFDVSRRTPGGDGALGLGEILDRHAGTGSAYLVSPRDLTRHTLVVGSTGSGKTNSVFHLLCQLAAGSVPFMVIEPTKTEYRALLADAGIGARIKVFTAGLETVAPVRLNPFEFPQGISLGEHLDWLRSAFAVSLGLWTPLPQVLERCLDEIYRDAGWDPVLGTNARVESAEDHADAFPTLSDLQRKIPAVVAGLGYSPETTAEIRGALDTRIRSLRSGGRGRMLAERRSTPAGVLFDGPVILELEAIGADEDKAFVMALLLLRLTEHRRTSARSEGLGHVLVLEEAHRVLAQTAPRGDERSADPRGRAVEAFAHLIAEVRAYGQAVVLVDQVPTRLASDAIKNTNLKIVHRLLAHDDRTAMGGSMAMTEPQVALLPALRLGEAAVHGPDDDGPLMVKVPKALAAGASRPDDAKLRALADVGGGRATPVMGRAREVAESDALQGTLSRCVQLALEGVEGLERAFERWRTHVPAEISRDDDRRDFEITLARLGAEQLAWRRGAQGGWPFSKAREFAARLAALFSALIEGSDLEKPLDAFRRVALSLHERVRDPYPACSRICSKRPGLCLHRLAAGELVDERRFAPAWERAGSARALWGIAMDAGFEVIPFPERPDSPDAAQGMEAGRRAALCFAQLIIYGDPAVNRQRAESRTARMIEVSGHEGGS